MAEDEKPLETPLVAPTPVEKRRTVRLSLDMQETNAQHLPLTATEGMSMVEDEKPFENLPSIVEGILLAETENPLETPLVAPSPVEKRRTVRLSLDIEETIAEHLPLTNQGSRGRPSLVSRPSLKSRGSRVSFSDVASFRAREHRVSLADGEHGMLHQTSSVHSRSPHAHLRHRTSLGSRRGSVRGSLAIDTGLHSLHSACPSLISFNSQNQGGQPSFSSPRARDQSRASVLTQDEGDMNDSRWPPGHAGGALGLCKQMVHTPRVRAWRHMLLPWVRWIPIEVCVLLFLVTPPFATILYNTISDKKIMLFGTEDWVRWMFPLTAWTHFSYLVIRVFATGFERLEVASLLMWSTWLIIFKLKRVCSKEFRRLLCSVLCAAMLVVYVLRLIMLGREIRRVSRQLVSKKKRRFVHLRSQFDLDLSYISRGIIAMGFPSQYTVEAQFRNPMEEVQRFFTERHKGHYKVYNLCAERTYTHKCFDHEFHDVRFPDHNPCPLAKLIIICNDMQAFQSSNRAQNVVAVHCKAGKGRTGLVIASYLLHSLKCRTAKEALERFGDKRTFNGKGVTIPSQIRYVHHYETLVREKQMRKTNWLRLRRLGATTSFPEDCSFQIVTHEEGLIFDSGSAMRSSSTSGKEKLPPLLEGDVKIVVFRATTKLFHFWFHTAYDPTFLQTNGKAFQQKESATPIWESSDQAVKGPVWMFTLEKKELDGMHKDKEDAKKHGALPSEFNIHVIFEKPSWQEEAEEMSTRQRERTRREVEKGRRKTLSNRRSTSSDGSARRSRSSNRASARENAVDYDEMGNDTDEEEMLSTLHRGFLLRSSGVCSRRNRRWCEISTCGKLHIAGANLLVVDVAAGEKVCRTVKGCDYAWQVRNPTNGTWETLEVEDGNDAETSCKLWDQAFADCMRLGDALRDDSTTFCGFFWKLNHDADEDLIDHGFEFSDWRVRLFVMRTTGQVVTYSWKDKTEKVFADFSSPLCCVEKKSFSWRNMPHTVPFQVLVAGEEPKVLAAKEEDYNSFVAKVQSLQAKRRPSKTVVAEDSFDTQCRTNADDAVVVTQW